MSLNTKLGIWVTLAQEKYPGLSISKLEALSMEAATAWYANDQSELANLFEQYVMLKQLKDM